MLAFEFHLEGAHNVEQAHHSCSHAEVHASLTLDSDVGKAKVELEEM